MKAEEANRSAPSRMISQTKKPGEAFDTASIDLLEVPREHRRSASSSNHDLDKLVAEEGSVWAEEQPIRPKSTSAIISKDWWKVGWHRNGSPSGTASSASRQGKIAESESSTTSLNNDTAPRLFATEPWDQGSMLTGTGAGLYAPAAPKEERSEMGIRAQADMERAMDRSRLEARQVTVLPLDPAERLRREEEDIQAALELSRMEASEATIRGSRGRLSRRSGQYFEEETVTGADEDDEVMQRVIEISKTLM
jgi:hypothetical protein